MENDYENVGATPSKTLMIRNMSMIFSEAVIRDIFSKFGNLQKCLVTDRGLPSSSYAFVEYGSVDEASKAKLHFESENCEATLGRRLRVHWASDEKQMIQKPLTVEIFFSFKSDSAAKLLYEATVSAVVGRLFSTSTVSVNVLDVALKQYICHEKNGKGYSGIGIIHFPRTIEGIAMVRTLIDRVNHVTVDGIHYRFNKAEDTFDKLMRSRSDLNTENTRMITIGDTGGVTVNTPSEVETVGALPYAGEGGIPYFNSPRGSSQRSTPRSAGSVSPTPSAAGHRKVRQVPQGKAAKGHQIGSSIQSESHQQANKPDTEDHLSRQYHGQRPLPLNMHHEQQHHQCPCQHQQSHAPMQFGQPVSPQQQLALQQQKMMNMHQQSLYMVPSYRMYPSPFQQQQQQQQQLMPPHNMPLYLQYPQQQQQQLWMHPSYYNGVTNRDASSPQSVVTVSPMNALPADRLGFLPVPPPPPLLYPPVSPMHGIHGMDGPMGALSDAMQHCQVAGNGYYCYQPQLQQQQQQQQQPLHQEFVVGGHLGGWYQAADDNVNKSDDKSHHQNPRNGSVTTQGHYRSPHYKNRRYTNNNSGNGSDRRRNGRSVVLPSAQLPDSNNEETQGSLTNTDTDVVDVAVAVVDTVPDAASGDSNHA